MPQINVSCPLCQFELNLQGVLDIRGATLKLCLLGQKFESIDVIELVSPDNG
jgi:hypothetical protein